MAAFVALSHFGVVVAGFNPGQWAVVCFYTLSGLLMERQFHKLSQQANGTAAFYLDRFLRIYPLFLVVLLLAWAGNRLSWGAAAANVTLLPLNYSSLLGIPMLIAPSFSLACEAHFYLLVPLLVFLSTRILRVILIASLCLFTVSPFLPQSTFWGFAGLPGILFTFLSGILLNRKDYRFIRVLWLVALLLLITFGLGKYLHAGLPTGININVTIGCLIALVSTVFLDKLSPRVQWDKFLGLFSYPLFLCHELAAGFLGRHWQIRNPLELLIGAVLLAGILIVTVEIPSDWFRYRLRRRQVPKTESGLAPR
ncbi:MAG TPA: acyltransferase [Verrucomicrobiae bacterium]|nr:acyltransferase [Verrucomicrobiae bacterium]